MDRLTIDTCVSYMNNILHYLVETKMKIQTLLFDLHGVSVWRFLSVILQLFFIILLYYPLNLKIIHQMECILKNLFSKCFHVNSREKRARIDMFFFIQETYELDKFDHIFDMFDLYYMLVIKLKLRQIDMKHANIAIDVTKVEQLLVELQPYYDYFLDNKNGRPNIVGKYWKWIVNDLIWIEFLSGRLSAKEKSSFKKKFLCPIDIKLCKIRAEESDTFDNCETIRFLILNNPKYAQMIQLYARNAKVNNLSLIVKQQYLFERVQIMIDYVSIYGKRNRMNTTNGNNDTTAIMSSYSYSDSDNDWNDSSEGYLSEIGSNDAPLYRATNFCSLRELVHNLGFTKRKKSKGKSIETFSKYKNLYYVLKNIVKNYPNQKLHVCCVCDTAKKQLKRCSNCKMAYYCSRKCQKRDWSNHHTKCIMYSCILS